MLVRPNTALYDELFARIDTPYTSRLPSHQTYLNALLDPSVGLAVLSPDIHSEDDLPGVTHSQQVKDLVDGTQRMIKEVATLWEGGNVKNASNGIGTGLRSSLNSAMTQPAYAANIAASVVGPVLTSTSKGGASGAASAAIAIGMAALSALGPFGQAAAAIVGFAAFLVRQFKGKAQLTKLEEQERLQKLYEAMPPLQTPGEETDSALVRSQVLPTLQTGSWTKLFSPRFDPRAEWVGVPREGGFAFAPGVRESGQDPFGNPLEVFKPSAGVGYVPGFQKITSVIQVGIHPLDPAITHWRDVSGPWPINASRVRDVGDFYVNTSRLCNVAWEWVTKREKSQDLYKVFVGTSDSEDDRCLHYRWRSYCESGRAFLQGNLESGLQGRVRDPDDPQWLFGSAIGCAIGSWSCWKKSNGKYVQTFPFGYSYAQMGPTQGAPLGCVVDPSTTLVQAGGRPCLTTIYETHIKTTLDRVRQRQIWNLRHTPICAVVRQGWDAFRDPELDSLLQRARKTLLTHDIRFTVSLNDVPEGEAFVHEGKTHDWKDLLRKRGVKAIPTVNALRAGPTPQLEPTTEDEPEIPEPLVAMPWTDHVPLPWWRTKAAKTATLVAALAGGTYGAYRYANRRRKA